MTSPIQEVLDQLNAERYSRSVWWSRPVLPASVTDDSEASCARRRAAIAQDFDGARKRGAA